MKKTLLIFAVIIACLSGCQRAYEKQTYEIMGPKAHSRGIGTKEYSNSNEIILDTTNVSPDNIDIIFDNEEDRLKFESLPKEEQLKIINFLLNNSK
ncbi:MAG: hypothetical protein WDA06_05595 [Phenylobacterium sp.]